MRSLWYALLIASLATGIASCGYKGKVRSPDQIQAANEKKARKAARNADDDASPEPADEAVPTPNVGANSNAVPPAKQPVVDAPAGTSAGRMSITFTPAERDDH